VSYRAALKPKAIEGWLESAARYPSNSLVPSKDQLAGFESIFLKVFQSGSQYDPGIVSGTRTPELALWQLRKLPAQAVDVLPGCVQPHAVRPGLLDAIAERAKKFLLQIDTGEAKHAFDGRANRAEFVEDKRKRIPDSYELGVAHNFFTLKRGC
jgi:hypothetical protein